MSEMARTAAEDALEAIYQTITTVANGLGEAEQMLPSRCAGWAVTDVLYHQLLDARRALRTFASPSEEPVDVDNVSYWAEYAPSDGKRASASAPRRPRTPVTSGSPRPPTRPALWSGNGVKLPRRHAAVRGPVRTRR